jgi:predicted kinase
MPQSLPTLHSVCGKAASGKSTLTAELGKQAHTVVISEDDWLAALYGDEMTSLQDYVRCSARLQAAMGPHVSAVLRSGVSVVLDFQANTLARRQWLHSLAQAADAAHKLHFLDVPDYICLARLRVRNASGSHPFTLSDEQFHQLSKHFAAPTPEEGISFVTYPPQPAGSLD